jgi:Tol biopolymer transport system component
MNAKVQDLMLRGLIVLAMLLPVLGSCSSGKGSGDSGPPQGTVLPAPLSEQYAIDGVADLSAFPNAQQQTIDLMSTFGTGTVVGTTTLRWAMANDERHLYIALEWTDATLNSFEPYGALDDFDGVVVMFDNNGDGIFEANEDARRLVMTDYGSSYSDIHNVASGDDMDTVGDGLGKMTWSNGVYQAEFLIPLAPDKNNEDGVLNANTRFNINILDHLQVALLQGNIGSLSGPPNMAVGMDSSAWPLLPYADAAPHNQPQLPNNLTGLIAFISDHENPKGELYTFDPASGVVTRVTQSTGLYMDGVSLSHDRTRLAFFGGASSTDYTTWEIYTVNRDGTDLRTLTTNTILDGHPAWSPDDSTIVYASFRDGWSASLVLMTAATGSELADLTPAGANDNDPDWTPDGRIVFKTDRFGTPGSPQVRIAVMDVDGSNVTQLTNTPGTSDHDPTATDTVTVFERFTRGTDYSSDPAAVFSPWNIVEARLDGSGERTLVADGWVNWLPVHDPGDEYLVYLKSVGYTDARLMTKDGRDLGRLIPDITKIRYIDWK